MRGIFASDGAAPHCPAGHFSPYSDGEKKRRSPLSLFLPVLRGEMPGRAMSDYLWCQVALAN
ncbi:hypothetical protein EN798_33325, partial [bacterium M00.F.Ca.ET.155.01.1.1]